MKSLKTHYSVFTAISAFLFIFILSASASASSNMLLQIEGTSGEGVYKAPVDGSGNCDFSDVKPGKYKVTLVVSNSVLTSRGVKPEANGSPSTIEISSFSWGVTNSSATGAGLGAGKASMSSFTTMRAGGEELPKESMERSAAPAPVTGGFTNKECKLTCRKAGGEQKDYYLIQFDNIVISSPVPDGSSDAKIKPGYNVKACVKM